MPDTTQASTHHRNPMNNSHLRKKISQTPKTPLALQTAQTQHEPKTPQELSVFYQHLWCPCCLELVLQPDSVP